MTFFRFTGKADRAEFLTHHLIALLVYSGLVALAIYVFPESQMPESSRTPINMLYFFIVFICFLDQVSVTIRRLDDIGRPSHHIWLLLFPFYNIYLAFVLLVKRGATEPNPLDIDAINEQAQLTERPSSAQYECSNCGSAIKWGERYCRRCGERLEYD